MSAQDLGPGRYDMQTSENFDGYMKALGVGLAMRTIANKLKPSQEISIAEDGTWNIKTISTFKSTDLKFKIGEQFDETTGDGRNVKSTFTIDGNTLIQNQEGEKGSTITREFSEDSFTMKLNYKDTTCTRVYKRVKK